MQMQLGQIGRVRGKSSAKRVHGSGGTKSNVPSRAPMRRKNRANVPSAARGTVSKASPISTERKTSTVPSRTPVRRKNRTDVPSAARGTVSKTSPISTESKTINVPSNAPVRRKNRADVLSAASAAVSKASTTPAKSRTVKVPSGAPVPRENRTDVLSPTDGAVSEALTTPAEDRTANVTSRALVPQANRACVLSAAGAGIPEGSTSALIRYWGRELTDKQKVATIIIMPFVAWRAYRARERQRRNAIQMLALGCVVRPVNVELRYSTSLQKLGVCISTPDTQSFRDMEFSLYLEPLTANIRARGKQLLQWLRHELTTHYMPKVWKAVEAGKRWCNLSGDQTHQAKVREQKEARSHAMIRLLKSQRLQPW